MNRREKEEIDGSGGGDLMVEEWTAPADGEKEVFFRNLFSTIQEPKYKGGWIGSGAC